MSYRAPCSNCNSRRFEEDNGVLFCLNCGQMQEGGVQQTGEDDENFTRGKVTKRKVTKSDVKVSKVYRGKKAYRLYLQAWQHILWKQVYALVQGTDALPTELWTTTRDLWTLMLSKLVRRLDEDVTELEVRHDNVMQSTEAINTVVQSNTANTASKTTAGVSSTEGDGQFTPTLSDTVSLIYIATVLLRLSFPLCKLYELLLLEQIPYIRAIRYVPYEMTSKLPPEYQLALDTTSVPERYDLQVNVSKLASSLHQGFGLILPPLNWKPILFWYIQTLGLPVEIFPAFKRLVKIVAFDFTYPTSAQDRNTQVITQEHVTRRRRTSTAWPEVQVASLLIVAVKLLFPFDQSVSGPSKTLSLSWKSWLEALRNGDDGKHSTSKRPIHLKASDVATTSVEDIDRYLDWYESTWPLGEEALGDKKTELERSLISMFTNHRSSKAIPSATLEKTPADQDTTFLKDVQANAMSYIIRDEGSLPATKYQIFPSEEVLGVDHSTNPVRVFHSMVADLASLDLGRLLRAIRHTEGLLEKWVHELRRDEALNRGRFDHM